MAEVQYHVGYRPSTGTAFAFSYTQIRPGQRKIVERYRLKIPKRVWQRVVRNMQARHGRIGHAAEKAAFEWLKVNGEAVDLGPSPATSDWY